MNVDVALVQAKSGEEKRKNSRRRSVEGKYNVFGTAAPLDAPVARTEGCVLAVIRDFTSVHLSYPPY